MSQADELKHSTAALNGGRAFEEGGKLWSHWQESVFVAFLKLAHDAEHGALAGENDREPVVAVPIEFQRFAQA